jgi:tellurite resistance protein
VRVTVDDLRALIAETIGNVQRSGGIFTREEAIEATILAGAIWAQADGWSEAKWKSSARKAMRQAQANADIQARARKSLVIAGSSSIH